MAKQKKEKVEFDEAQHGETLKNLIKAASDAKLKAEGYMDEVASNRAEAKAIGVEAKLFNQLLTIYHKGTRERFASEKDEVVETYDRLFD
ncbi:double-stranded DNA binding protein [Klebsiella phage Marfa]|uniref:Double-stranded DNA binding protein n=1 Tax=Klebsiella phage Marfa TaxID=2587809 RepID=A0A4Y5TS76_9CAUD|nr:double-stranded DNA binding protein [Klebsiella phage Marfa]QDB71903.1 double-stranded DNA binding protein [Klebsiella phage Marfa]